MKRCWTRTIAGMLALVGLLLVTACGKKGPPVPAGPQDKITWPRAYPTH